MAFATANSPANRKPGDNAQTATPPQAQARQRQSPGKTRDPSAPEPASAHRAPNTRQDLRSACQSPRARQDRQRAPGRKPGSGALAEPSSGLRGANRAKQRVPRALAGPSSEFPRRRIVNLVQPWSKLTIFRSFKAKMHDYLRYRKAHTRTTDRNVHFSLPRPRKTVCFGRWRSNQTVFRIARPARQPNPMPNKQHSHHRSR